MHANAVTHEAAHPEQHKAKVTAMATRLAELPKAEAGCQEERERALAANYWVTYLKKVGEAATVEDTMGSLIHYFL